LVPFLVQKNAVYTLSAVNQEFKIQLYKTILIHVLYESKTWVSHLNENRLKVFGNTVLRNYLHLRKRSRNSVVSIAIGNGLDESGAGVQVLVKARIFSSPCCPDWLGGPPSLLSNGYRGSFPGGKAAGRGMKLTIHLQLVPMSRKCGSIHPLPHTPSLHNARLIMHRDITFLPHERASNRTTERKVHNEELHNLSSSPDIIIVFKSAREVPHKEKKRNA
jgi:hypothetical protein